MGKRNTIAVFALLLMAGAVYATERAANKYKTHKLSLNAVMVSCEDEREPVAKKLENGPFIVITCDASQQAK